MSTEDTHLQTLLVIVGVVLLVPFLVMAVMLPMMGMWSGRHMGTGTGGMWGGTGPAWLWVLMWLAVLTVVLGVGYLLYRSLRRADTQDTDVALEELRISYARGELTDEEFEHRRTRLQQEE